MADPCGGAQGWGLLSPTGCGGSTTKATRRSVRQRGQAGILAAVQPRGQVDAKAAGQAERQGEGQIEEPDNTEMKIQVTGAGMKRIFEYKVHIHNTFNVMVLPEKSSRQERKRWKLEERMYEVKITGLMKQCNLASVSLNALLYYFDFCITEPILLISTALFTRSIAVAAVVFWQCF